MITEELKAQMVGVVRDWNIQEQDMTPALMKSVMKEALHRMDNLTCEFLWGYSDRAKESRDIFYKQLYVSSGGTQI